jgi:valyl-tRNA synthetase
MKLKKPTNFAGEPVLNEPVSGTTLTPEWIFDTRVDQEFIEVDGVTYKRDEDTFDTWFSSGQLPFIDTDWPVSGDLSRFYPTTVMETGHDILRPWVARMIMLGLYVTGQVPFREVYLHGLVNDENNQKMSKSKGNVVNPMEVLTEYGSDALRMGIVANRSAGVNQAFSTATVVAGRNFCNKLWNMARFAETASWRIEDRGLRIEDDGLRIENDWVLRQLDNARIQIEKLLAEYRFAEAYEALYHVVWDDVADWYIEATKVGSILHPPSSILQFQDVLKYILKLAHPFAPFVTETIWQSLLSDDKSTTLLISQQWPKKLKYDALAAAEFDRIRELVTEIRYLAAELGGGKRVLYFANDELVAQNAELIKHLANLTEVKQTDQTTGLRIAAENREAWLSASQSELVKHYETLENRLADTRQAILNLEKRLGNKGYVERAPQELVAESRAELATKKALAERLEAELKINN